MTDLSRAEIRLGHRKHSVVIGDHDISNATRGLVIRHTMGDLPTIELDLVVLNLGTKANARIVLSPATHDALIALGWTPPCTCPNHDVTTLGQKPGTTTIKGLDPACPHHGRKEP